MFTRFSFATSRVEEVTLSKEEIVEPDIVAVVAEKTVELADSWVSLLDFEYMGVNVLNGLTVLTMLVCIVILSRNLRAFARRKLQERKWSVKADPIQLARGWPGFIVLVTIGIFSFGITYYFRTGIELVRPLTLSLLIVVLSQWLNRGIKEHYARFAVEIWQNKTYNQYKRIGNTIAFAVSTLVTVGVFNIMSIRVNSLGDMGFSNEVIALGSSIFFVPLLQKFYQSVMMSADVEMQKGEQVQFGEFKGELVRVTDDSIQIKLPSGAPQTLPNSLIAGKAFTNLSRASKRDLSLSFLINVDADTDKMTDLRNEVIKYLESEEECELLTVSYEQNRTDARTLEVKGRLKMPGNKLDLFDEKRAFINAEIIKMIRTGDIQAPSLPTFTVTQ